MSANPSPPPESLLELGRLKFSGLFEIVARERDLPWEPFREGVEVYWLYGDGHTGPSAALLKFAPGAGVSLHEHGGYEHIIVLAGEQSDHRGSAGAGTLLINSPGTRHRVKSESGCIVLVIYERPVRFLE